MAKYNDLFIPEALGTIVEEGLAAKLQAMSYMKVDNTLQNTQGDSVKIPKYTFAGEAEDLAEGAQVPFATISSSVNSYTVKKAGNGFKMTDEEMLYGVGDPLGFALKRLTLSLADKMDSEFYVELEKATIKHTGKPGYLTVVDALAKLNLEDESNLYLFVNPAQYGDIRKDEHFLHASQLGDKTIATGVVGEIAGVKVVVSKKVAANKWFIAVSEAVSLFMKRDIQLETDRDITRFENVAAAGVHYVVALTDATKVVAGTVTAAK